MTPYHVMATQFRDHPGNSAVTYIFHQLLFLTGTSRSNWLLKFQINKELPLLVIQVILYQSTL